MVGQVALRAPGVASGTLPRRPSHAGHAQDSLPVRDATSDVRWIVREAAVAPGVPSYRDSGQSDGAGKGFLPLQHDHTAAQSLPVQVSNVACGSVGMEIPRFSPSHI